MRPTHPIRQRVVAQSRRRIIQALASLGGGAAIAGLGLDHAAAQATPAPSSPVANPGTLGIRGITYDTGTNYAPGYTSREVSRSLAKSGKMNSCAPKSR